MRRLVIGLVVLSVACALPTMTGAPGPMATPTATAIPATPSPTPTRVAPPRPTYTPTPAPRPTATPEPDPRLEADDVLFLPQPLFVGDRLSVDVDPTLPDGIAWEAGDEPTITLSLPDGTVATSLVEDMGLDGVPQARFYWLDVVPSGGAEQLDEGRGTTTGAPGGTTVYTITLNLPDGMVDPNLDNNTLVLPVQPLARESLPPPEPDAQWALTDTTGFSLHYITGTAAERDLSAILDTATEAYQEVTTELQSAGVPATAEADVQIYLLDRVIGQGGYASPDWVAVTYTDRSYAPVSLDLVFRHELTHRLDGALGCENAPAMLREGLAVFVAGGHYRRDPLQRRAAALFGSTHYIPLPDLPDDFYTHQHEVAYLEAGAIVNYLVERWGWEVLPRLCRAASTADGGEKDRWEAALETIGVAGSEALERQWHSWLQDSHVTPQDARLLELELKLMDTMRDYQVAFDPAAHFLEGVLFSPAEAEDRDIVADFVRRPRDPEAISLELLLAMGQEALVQGDPVRLEMLLATLDVAMEEGLDGSAFAADVLTVSQDALGQGWEPYRLVLEDADHLRVYVLSRAVWPQKSVMLARREGKVWQLSGTVWTE